MRLFELHCFIIILIHLRGTPPAVVFNPQRVWKKIAGTEASAVSSLISRGHFGTKFVKLGHTAPVQRQFKFSILRQLNVSLSSHLSMLSVQMRWYAGKSFTSRNLKAALG